MELYHILEMPVEKNGIMTTPTETYPESEELRGDTYLPPATCWSGVVKAREVWKMRERSHMIHVVHYALPLPHVSGGASESKSV